MRWVSYGGAPIAESLVHAIKEAFPNARVGNGFGLTETSSLTTFLPHEEAAEHADSVGFAMPVVDLAIDRARSRRRASASCSSAARTSCRATGTSPRRRPRRSSTAGCTPATSARIDEDGLLYIVDRKKDMINRGGENVYSIEVENALAGAPGVGEAAAVGVPDEMMGEKVGAVIVPAAGASSTSTPSSRTAASGSPTSRCPQYVAVRAEPLPRNPGGKVLKAQLRDETDWGEPLR